MDSYWRRYFSRFRKEAAPWARDNIFWAAIMLVAPAFATWIAHPNHEIDWAVIKAALWIYAVAFAIYLVIHLARTAKVLDDEAQGQSSSLRAQVATLEQAKKDADQSVTSKQWLETAEKFRKWAGYPGIRVQYQTTRGVVKWYQHRQDLESLCALAGAMLLKSPRVAKRLSERVLTQTKHSDRWLTFLLETKGSMDVGCAIETLDDGTPLNHVIGYLSDTSQLSVNVCTENSAEEI